MWCCQREGSSRVCPGSFGFALGVTGALAVMVWGIYGMYFGVTGDNAMWQLIASSWSVMAWHAFCVFLKGLVFGYVLIFFYNYFSCCCKSMCKKSLDKRDGNV